MAAEALASLGLADKADRLPGRIPGAKKEQVAIARSIVSEPTILLPDEPNGNHNTRTTHEIMELPQRLNTVGMAILMLTHSYECAANAKRIL